MRVNDASNADQLIKIFAESAQTQQDISAALLKKQQDVDKSTGNAIVQLLQSAASLSDSGNQLDVRG